MIKKIDWYIIKKFIGTFFFIIILLSMVSVVIDLVEKMEDFISKDAPTSAIIFDYVLNFIPYINGLISPLFVFIAVIFFTSKMASRSEIVAILASGVSYYRFLLPYFISACLLGGLLYYCNHWLIPNANAGRAAFEVEYYRNPYVNRDRNIHLQIQPNTYIYMESYNASDSTGYKFALEKFDKGELVYKLRSKRVKWNKKQKKWSIIKYTVRTFNKTKETFKEGEKIDTTLNFSPSDFERRHFFKETMTTPVLEKFIEQERSRGSDKLVEFELEKHRRSAAAASVFILTLIGVSIASRKVRGGMGLHLAFGIALSALFILVQQFSMTFSTNAGLEPILGVWIPNVLFSFVALYLLWTTPK